MARRAGAQARCHYIRGGGVVVREEGIWESNRSLCLFALAYLMDRQTCCWRRRQERSGWSAQSEWRFGSRGRGSLLGQSIKRQWADRRQERVRLQGESGGLSSRARACERASVRACLGGGRGGENARCPDAGGWRFR